MQDVFGNSSSDLALKAFNLFIETARSVLKDADSFLYRVAGLSAGKFAVLIVLNSNGGTMTAAKLAERTGTRPHNITKLVDHMKKDGLVATERGHEDRRFVHIRLTGEGHLLLAKAMPVAKRKVNRIMATISEYDLAELLRLLSIMKQNTSVKEY